MSPFGHPVLARTHAYPLTPAGTSYARTVTCHVTPV
jgi:hypothetical protein